MRSENVVQFDADAESSMMRQSIVWVVKADTFRRLFHISMALLLDILCSWGDDWWLLSIQPYKFPAAVGIT